MADIPRMLALIPQNILKWYMSLMYCKELLTQKVLELGFVAKEAILHPEIDEETSNNESTAAHTEDINTIKHRKFQNVSMCTKSVKLLIT